MLDSFNRSSRPADGVFVGVDWGNSPHQLCVLDDGRTVVEQGKFTTMSRGPRARPATGRHGPVTGIAIERSEGLLVESLQQQGHRLFCVSPKMSARARERYRLAPTKSDAFDAFVLADSLRHEHRHWRPVAVPSHAAGRAARADPGPRAAGLQPARRGEPASRDRGRPTTPRYCTCSPAWTATSRWRSCATTPHPPRPAGSGRHGWRRSAPVTDTPAGPNPSCWSSGCGRTCCPPRRAPSPARRSAPCCSSTSSSCSTPTSAPSPSGSASCWPAPRRRDLPQLPRHRARSSPRPCSPRWARTASRFPTADVLLAETGTAPVTRSSGRSRTVRFRYAANKRMRHAIDWWAFVSVRENDWAHDAYQQARARGQLHNRALRGIGARWTRILWRCWTDHTPYDPGSSPNAPAHRRDQRLTETRPLPSTPPAR